MKRLIFLLFATVLVLTGCSSNDISALQEENGKLKKEISELKEKEVLYINEINDLKAQVSEFQDLVNTMTGEGVSSETVKSGEGTLVLEVINTSYVTEINNGPVSIKAKPEGKFVILDLKAENIGKKAIIISVWNLKLYDSEDREFKIPAPPSFGIPEEERFFVNLNMVYTAEIAPGFSKEGKIVFEVPSASSGFRLQVDCDELQTSIPIPEE